jgi:hypothetical protein
MTQTTESVFKLWITIQFDVFPAILHYYFPIKCDHNVVTPAQVTINLGLSTLGYVRIKIMWHVQVR